jgi:hypothetical protein
MSFDTYAYPLVHDGVTMAPLSQAQVIVVLCYSSRVAGCGSGAEGSWAASRQDLRVLNLIDSFIAVQGRTIAVFERAPLP